MGGGIYNTQLGTVNVINGSHVDFNEAQHDGGGIFNNGGLVNFNSYGHAYGNTAGSALGGSAYTPIADIGGNGGGVFNTNSGTVNIGATGSLGYVDGNNARYLNAIGGNGGGVYNDGAGAILNVTAGRVNTNDADIDGGGIFNNGGTVLITEASSVNYNEAGVYSTTGALGGDGGGIFIVVRNKSTLCFANQA